MSRSFRGYARNLATSSFDKLKAYATSGPSNSEEYDVLDIRHVAAILLHDLVFGFLRMGGLLFAPLVGTTQGSPLAPGVCLMVCAYLKAMSYKPCRTIHCPWGLAQCLRMRWVDDPHIIIIWIKDVDTGGERGSY